MRGFCINIAGIIIFFNLEGIFLSEQEISEQEIIKDEFKNFICKCNKKPDITFSLKQSCLLKLRTAEMLFDQGGLRQIYKTKENILYVYRDSNNRIKRIFEVNQNVNRVKVYFNEKNPKDLFAEIKANFLRPFLPDYLATKRKGIMVHGAFIKDGDKTYLFLGKSGAGKSTMSEIWAREFKLSETLKCPKLPDDKKGLNYQQKIFNDDRAIIRVKNSRALFFNAPWNGDAGKYCESKPVGNISIDRIFFIYHEKINVARRLSKHESTIKIFRNAFPILWRRDGLDYALKISEETAGRIPCYDLGFVRNRKIVDYIRSR